MTYKALAFDPDTCLKKDLIHASLKVEFSTAKTANELYASVNKDRPDVVVLHVDRTKMKAADLVNKLRKHNPGIPAILIIGEPNSALWDQAVDPLVDLVRSPIDSGELHYRIARLLSGLPKIKPGSTHKVRVWTQNELRNDETGRLDATRISNLFGLSLSDVARIIGRPLSSVHKTPDAPGLQKQLLVFERIASAVVRMSGSSKGLRIWLNAPNREFDGEFPINLIKRGISQAEMIAGWLEDALLGHPD